VFFLGTKVVSRMWVTSITRMRMCTSKSFVKLKTFFYKLPTLIHFHFFSKFLISARICVVFLYLFKSVFKDYNLFLRKKNIKKKKQETKLNSTTVCSSFESLQSFSFASTLALTRVCFLYLFFFPFFPTLRSAIEPMHLKQAMWEKENSSDRTRSSLDFRWTVK